MPTSKEKLAYLAPNLITTLSLLSAFVAMLLSSQGEYYKSILAVFLSALLDGMDGRVARFFNSQSSFGEQYDSLADLVAFGLAPSLIVYNFSLHSLDRAGLACAFIFTACAAFRLARFNVQIGEVDKSHFVGLPSPLAAILVVSLVIVLTEHKDTVYVYQSYIAVILAIWVLLCGLLMISNRKYYSFKELDTNQMPLILLMISTFFVVSYTYSIALGICIMGIVYIFSGILTKPKT